MTLTLTNRDLAELLARAAGDETPDSNRFRALQRASRAAFHWPEEASELVAAGGSATELRAIGPWLAGVLQGWIEADEPPSVPQPPPLRQGFLTLSEVRSAIRGADPSWTGALQADLQMHTTYSDGKASLPAMVRAASALGYRYVNITDHSKGLPIARGIDEARLAEEGREVATLNAELERAGGPIRVLHGMEMNLSPLGEGDMDPAALARLDLVLGAFHSKLRETQDQTERYLAALANPTVDVLAHPRGRRFGVRLGLQADWPRVFSEAAGRGVALEIDAYPDRQDLDVGLLRLARDAGCWISIGTDAHSVAELRFMEFGIAAAILAELPRERILNFLSLEDLRHWVMDRRERATAARGLPAGLMEGLSCAAVEGGPPGSGR